MIELFEYPHTVGDDEIDEQGRANNVVYLAWMQEAAIAHSAVLGWTPERYVRLGVGWVARSHWIEYLQPAVAGDEIVVQTHVADMKKVTSKRVYRICAAATAKCWRKLRRIGRLSITPPANRREFRRRSPRRFP